MDHSATTPIDTEVLETMKPYFTEFFGNPSSLHTFGREASEAIEKAREQVAQLINADETEIIFTSGGTESNNIALRCASTKKWIITSTIEHPAVLTTCKYLQSIGFKVTYIPVDEHGIVSINEIANTINDDVGIVSIMHANNEIGTIEPITEIGKICAEHDVLFHTDAVQSCGKIEVDVKKMNIDLLTISSHKMYGPMGVGALYVRKGMKIGTFIYGGGHEKGIRSGTENVAGIVGFGKACELARIRLHEDSLRLTKMRDNLITEILKIDESYLNGHPIHRLPNNANFRFTGVEGESLVLSLDAEGIAVSTGSACSSKKLEPSHVLMAIGLSEVEAHGSLRLTLGRGNTDDDINYVVEVLPKVVDKLRSISPLWLNR
jgi:cysteine desulfurase